MRRGQRHGHGHAAILGNVDTVDQAQVIDVDRDFRIENVLERGDHAFVDIAARFARSRPLRLFGQEAFQIVALALQLVGRSFGIFHLGARRGRNAGYFLDDEFGFLAHPKILRVLSMPRSRAAMSSLSE